MAATTAGQSQLFPDEATRESGVVHVNEQCRLRTQDGYRVVSFCGMPVMHYPVGDRVSEAFATVNLVNLGWAQQNEVAHAFAVSDRTVRRNQERFASGGLQALGRPSGYPKGRARLPASHTDTVSLWKGQGDSNREIARRIGVNEKAVRKLLRRLGWEEEQPEQFSLYNSQDAGANLSGSGQHEEADGAGGSAAEAAEDADPNLSGPGQQPSRTAVGKPAAEAAQGEEQAQQARTEDADPNLSASSLCPDPWVPPSLDADPSDRSVDRSLACLGLLDDAAPLFRPGSDVAGVGALLAIPALVQSGVLEIAHEVYASIGPAFYGLRTSIVTFLLMALLRVKRVEGLKECSPQDLGRILGLDRAPEVKTLRRKLARLASYGRAAEFGHALAQHRVDTRGHAMGFLYLDGHVRAYHGKHSIPKTHVARMRISMPATTDYWVNDAEGEPLFVVTTEANKGLVKILPEVLAEVRLLVAERRLTVIFDRGGWSPKLFKKIVDEGFDIITYRKGRSRRVAKSRFSLHEASFDGCKISYLLADQNVLLLKRKLPLRQVTRLSPNGHQTPILTSRRDLSAVEVAYRMFERWRQENFFKYLREEYALDALVDYAVEPAEPTRSVPNPKRKQLNAELKRAQVQLDQIEAEYGLEALENPESRRRTMRGFKIANSELAQRIRDAMKRVVTLEKRRVQVPARVPVQEVVKGEVVKLAVERHHLTNLLKMVAYQAEGDLLRILELHYRRSDDEGRTLIQNALASPGDIALTENELRVSLRPLSSPHRTRALAALCEQLNETKTRFPGSRLRLRFNVQKEPSPSMAFPGPRPSECPTRPGQPDTQHEG